MLADEMVLVNEINAGDIGAFLGLKNLRSGDTIVDELDVEEIQLKGMKMPPPVFFCSIEPEEFRDQNKLTELLSLYSLEDPSLIIKYNEETG